MYGVIRKIRLFNLPISCQFDLFDKVVLPVLIYRCEIWGCENLQIVERIHLKFLKHFFSWKVQHPHLWYMVKQVVSQSMFMCIVEWFPLGLNYHQVVTIRLYMYHKFFCIYNIWMTLLKTPGSNVFIYFKYMWFFKYMEYKKLLMKNR